jgi:hypothetical protein
MNGNDPALVLTRKMATFYNEFLQCRSGGTGRHARLRGVWGNPWGFKSPLRHQFIGGATVPPPPAKPDGAFPLPTLALARCLNITFLYSEGDLNGGSEGGVPTSWGHSPERSEGRPRGLGPLGRALQFNEARFKSPLRHQ